MKVFITSYLSEIVGRTELSFDLREELALADFFRDVLFAQYPSLMPRVLDETGNIRPHVAVFVQDRRVRTIDDVIAIEPAGEVSILPALSGG